jgi:hypothetical protein
VDGSPGPSDRQAGNRSVWVVVTFGLDLDRDGLVKAGENGRLPPVHRPPGSYGNKAKPKRNRDSQQRQAASSPEVLPFLPSSTSSSVDLLQLLPSVFLYKGKEEAGWGGGGGSMT